MSQASFPHTILIFACNDMHTYYLQIPVTNIIERFGAKLYIFLNLREQTPNLPTHLFAVGCNLTHKY